ncbi:tape measure protein [Capnocytophaga gingivalis]|uniref:tape measure protein n=1 Tax=Capnocytophaga gingivalis TaxID=1017 RepID=UPI003C77FA1D
MQENEGKLLFEVRADQSDIKKDIEAIKKQFESLTEKTKEEGKKQAEVWQNLVKGATAYFTLQGASAFIKQVVAVRSQFQQLEISFGTMLKSKEKANALMAQMADLAAKTPFGLEEVSEGAKRLLAFQVPAEEVTETLRRMGDVAAGLGVPMGQLIHVYGQVKAQGKLMTNDLYQFMNAGIPIIAELSKVVGKSETEIKDMVSAGKIGFSEVQAVIKNMTNEGGLFFNLMAEQSKSLGGQISNLGDSFDQMLNDIGKASEGYISGAIQGVTFLVENYKTLGKVIAGLIVTYGAYRTAVLVNIALTKGWAVAAKEDAIAKGIQTVATNAATAATKALNAAMKANPYVLVATAVVGLVSAVVLFNKEMTVAEKAQKAYNEEQERQKGVLQKEREEYEQLIDVVKDENQSKGKRIEAFQKLQSLYPDIFSKYKTEEELIKNISKALKELNGVQKDRDLKMDQDYMQRLEMQKKALQSSLRTSANPAEIANIKEQIQSVDIQIEKARKQYNWQSTLNKIDALAELSADDKVKERKLMIEEYNRRHNAKQAKNQNLLQEGEKKDIRKTSLPAVVATGYENFTDADLGLLMSKSQGFIDLDKEHNKVISDRKQLLTDLKDLQQKIDALQKKDSHTQNDIDELNKLKKDKENKEAQLKGEYNEQGKTKTTKATKTKSELSTFDQEAHLLQTTRLVIDNELAQQKANIEQMQDGYDKELALIHYFYDEKAEAIRRGGEDARIALDKERADSKGLMSNETYNARLNAINENEIIANEQNSALKTQQEQKLLDGLLEKYQNYFQKRKSLVEKQEKDLIELGKILSNEQLEELKKKQQAELDELDDAYISKNNNYKKLFEDLRELSNKEIEEAIKEAKKLLLITNMSDEMRKSINSRIKDTERMFSQKKLSEINQYSQAVRELSKAFSELGSSTGNSSLSSLGAAIGNIAGQFTGLMEVMNKYKNGNISSADKVGAVAGFASNLISSIADSARQRKEAEERYYTSVIGYQNAYNLALIEQKRIQKDLDSSFLLKDRTEQLKHEFDIIRNVGKAQSEQLEQIRRKGQVKVGTENRTDWGGVAGITAGGAVTGAMIGGPVGAVVGAVAGFIGGLFSSKKPKDVFGNLLQTYPKLLEQSANGVWKINKAQAENVKNSGLVNEETKLMLQQYIDLENELEKSRTKIKEIVTEFAGNLAPNIQNSLVEAFKAGEDAIVKMGETMDKVVENMVSSIIFQSIFKDTFKKLEDEMQKSKDVGGDGNWVDDFGRFYREAGAKTKQYYEALAQARDSAKAEGFNILQDNEQRKAVEKGFARMSQDTGEELNGQFRLQTQLSAEIKNAMLQSVKEFAEMHKFMQTSSAQQLRHLAGIEANTFQLHEMKKDISGMKTILGNIETKGIKMRT